MLEQGISTSVNLQNNVYWGYILGTGLKMLILCEMLLFPLYKWKTEVQRSSTVCPKA